MATSACPNLSGKFDITYDDGLRTEDSIEQRGCESVRATTRMTEDGQPYVFSYEFQMDGKFREIRNMETGKVDGHASYKLLGNRHIIIWIMDPGYTGKLEIATVITELDGADRVRIVKTITDGDGKVLQNVKATGIRKKIRQS